MRLYFVAVGTVILATLTGCVVVYPEQFTMTTKQVLGKKVEPNVKKGKLDEATGALSKECLDFKAPRPAPLPPIPEIAEDRLNDNKYVQTVLVQSISEHRAYIRESNRRFMSAIEDYRKRCLR